MSNQNIFEPFMNKGYSIDIQFIHKPAEGVKVYSLLIKWYNNFVFEAYWIDYPSDELILSIIRGHHRNEMLNRLLPPKIKTTFII